MSTLMFQRTNGQSTDVKLPYMSEWSSRATLDISNLNSIADYSMLRKLQFEGVFASTIPEPSRMILGLPFLRPPVMDGVELYFYGTWEREVIHGQFDRMPSEFYAPVPEDNTWPTSSTVNNLGAPSRFTVKLTIEGRASSLTTASQISRDFNSLLQNRHFKNHFEWQGEQPITASNTRTLSVTWTPIERSVRRIWPVYVQTNGYLLHTSLTSDFVFVPLYNPATQLRFDTGAINMAAPSYGIEPAQGIVTVTGKASVTGTPNFLINASASNKAVMWTAPFQVEANKWFKIMIDNTSPYLTILTGITADEVVR